MKASQYDSHPCTASIRALATAVMVSAMFSATAAADCVFWPGYSTVEVLIPVPDEIVIPILGDSWQTWRAFGGEIYDSTTYLDCVAPFQVSRGLSQPAVEYLNPTPYRMYHTNLPGLATRSVTSRGQGQMEMLWPPTVVTRLDGGFVQHSRFWTFELLVMSPYVAGGTLLLPNPLMQVNYGSQVAGVVRFDKPSVIVRPVQPTCTVHPLSENIRVDFGELSLNGLNSESVAVPITISLECVGGQVGLQRAVHVSLTDASEPGNASELLTLSAGSEAAGAGIRITRDNGIAVRYGPPATTVGAAHQWLAGRVGTGTSQFDIALQARLVQTANEITPGELSAQATFTIAYD